MTTCSNILKGVVEESINRTLIPSSRIQLLLIAYQWPFTWAKVFCSLDSPSNLSYDII